MTRVLLNRLDGDESTVKALNASYGKIIKKLSLVDDALILKFEDNSILSVFDDEQSCCETRYLVTDDNLEEFKESKLIGIEVREAPYFEMEYGVHEVQFLVIITDKGNITLSNHNEHNGYYSGFRIVAKLG